MPTATNIDAGYPHGTYPPAANTFGYPVGTATRDVQYPYGQYPPVPSDVFGYPPGIPPAAFPVIASTSTRTTLMAGASTANPITAPAGVVAGDLLVAFATISVGQAITASTGWTELNTYAILNRLTCFARIADGGANDALVVRHTNPGNAAACASIHRITGHTVTNVATNIKSANAAATTGTSNPPSLDAGSVKKWLWLAVNCLYQTHGGIVTTAIPANYTSVVSLVAADIGTTLAVTRRDNEVQTEDPAAFTSTAGYWQCFTVAVPG